jgi:hypothetical protein
MVAQVYHLCTIGDVIIGIKINLTDSVRGQQIKILCDYEEYDASDGLK